MPYLSPRQLALPLTSLVAFVLLLRLFIYKPPPDAHVLLDQLIKSQSQHGITINVDDDTHPTNFQSPSTSTDHQFNIQSLFTYPPPSATNIYLAPLLNCNLNPDPVTQHIRLPKTPYIDISMTPPDHPPTQQRYFNPTLLPLPSWSLTTHNATYLLVSRLVTSGLHQESHICLAHLSHTHTSNQTADSIGVLQCTHEPIPFNIPPTPSLRCEGEWTPFPHIPGFHDPRIFWSGLGEPLILVNSASGYGCVGLWLQDLRPLFPTLESVVNRRGVSLAQPRIAWEGLSEVVRQDRGTMGVEKNWWLWWDEGMGFVGFDLVGRWKRRVDHEGDGREGGGNRTNRIRHEGEYEYVGGGRTFAKMIGHGYTTPNLTDPGEMTCFHAEDNFDVLGQEGHWHQGANPLRLVLCTREQLSRGKCGQSEQERVEQGQVVWFGVVHRKFVNEMRLPMRYERRFVVWEGRWPYRVVGRSKWAVLVGEEVARMDGRREHVGVDGNVIVGARISKRGEARKEVYFTYTSSLAWAWRSRNVDAMTESGSPGGSDAEFRMNGDEGELTRLGTGFLGDDVLMGIGMDDVEQAVVKVKIEDLLQCLELCPRLDVK